MTIPQPTPSKGTLPQVPPELLYLLLDAVGGSYTATSIDLARYDPTKDVMEVIIKYDPYMVQIKFSHSEDRSPASMRPLSQINLNAQSVVIEATPNRNLDPNLLPVVPTNGHQLITPDGELLFYWSVFLFGVYYSGWWDKVLIPTSQDDVSRLRYTPDGRRIG